MSTCDGWHLFLQVLRVFSSFIQDLHSTGSPGVPRLKAEYTKKRKENKRKGAQWLSGRVLDSRPKGRGFEPHRRHCVVVLEQDTFILA